ncbi:MAG: molybdopterin molybdotransferase MoeA [Eubacteriales bacterium]|nr:molybdopterin molybdotransferase MoeA [Eubacteriales bacterium]
MSKFISHTEARSRMLERVFPVDTEQVSLSRLPGRILARDVSARESIPPFDRSPYDGYAFRAGDTVQASQGSPVTLRILEEIPAGSVSHCPVTEGCAVKVLTGAPIPDGADAVIKFERTEFTAETVTIFSPCKSGSNIVRAGEDVRAGDLLVKAGARIDAGLLGTLASQNIPSAEVYRVPRIGIISTGSELVEVGSPRIPGKIYDSNRYMLCAAVSKLGMEPVLIGQAADNVPDILACIRQGLAQCDGLLLTGGVSVGDYDLTPDAMEQAGVELLFRGVDMKPGMACAYGVWEGKPVCALSGNPASAITNFHAIAAPVLRKLSGQSSCIPQEISVKLVNGFRKKSPGTRFLRGMLDLSDGTVRMRVPSEQGNAVLSSAIGCNVMAIIPAGSDAIPEGTELKGFLI